MFGTNPTDEEYLAGYKANQLRVDPFRNGSGKFINVATDYVDDVVEINERIGLKVKLIKAKEDIQSIQLTRLVKKDGAWDPLSARTLDMTSFSFAKLKHFLEFISQLDLPSLGKERIELTLQIDDPNFREKLFTALQTEKGFNCLKELLEHESMVGLGDIENIADKKSKLAMFEKMLMSPEYVQEKKKEWELKKEGDECVWQHFFENNTWIFGYCLDFVFNAPLSDEKLEHVLRGSDYSNKGIKPDAILRAKGFIDSLCLVEIKTPDSNLLTKARIASWKAHADLTEGIAQSHVAAYETIKRIRLAVKDGEGKETGEYAYGIEPKSYLIIGNLKQLFQEGNNEMIDMDKLASFELLRKKTLSPEIITFDELLERAKFIVRHKSS